MPCTGAAKKSRNQKRLQTGKETGAGKPLSGSTTATTTKTALALRYFAAYKKHVKILDIEKKKVFHSLRGNWITRANRLGLNQGMCRELTGHSQGVQLDAHTLSYDEDSDLYSRHAEINKLHYDIDLSKIAAWRPQEFY